MYAFQLFHLVPFYPANHKMILWEKNSLKKSTCNFLTNEAYNLKGPKVCSIAIHIKSNQRQKNDMQRWFDTKYILTSITFPKTIDSAIKNILSTLYY